jgi:hypothetical protein
MMEQERIECLCVLPTSWVVRKDQGMRELVPELWVVNSLTSVTSELDYLCENNNN